ncbi:SDR family NAD(P)-dependent oxidoreductase [Paenibacillus sp. OAS669]|uniref:SDR family NAD(P)-dependent oxidoreductase n=1 Tax=Paenibacillus sp. OAS669 TaxID=2663821 RepID=UPI00178BA502|nr:SDR family NAD(P)-dependent oxidoreductase [Paenibacillus sp. OAS669]MBE1446636.1 3-oxoacyl-[acyl-carrier protein] reductase [Paenibacillus sp. OAS669]
MDIAVVTGAGRGIGAAIAQKLASEKLMVIFIANKSVESAEQKARDIRKHGGQAEVVPCDVTKKEDIEQALRTIERSWGIPSVLINNAGVGGPYHAIDQVSEEEWDWIMNTNIKSMFLFCKYLLPRMKEAGYGRIVNLSSIFGVLGGAQSVAYSTSKHAIIGFTKSIAAEWGPYGITCNALCPGFVDTEMGVQEQQVNNHHARIIEKSPVKRVGTPEEVADLAYYLVGPSSSYVNGASFFIDGGLSAHAGI